MRKEKNNYITLEGLIGFTLGLLLVLIFINIIFWNGWMWGSYFC